MQVKVGDSVERGQVVGRMGNSGDSLYPHLHYQLTNGPDWRDSEGLPTTFSAFDLVLGTETVHLTDDSPDTGEVIIT